MRSSCLYDVFFLILRDGYNDENDGLAAMMMMMMMMMMKSDDADITKMIKTMMTGVLHWS